MSYQGILLRLLSTDMLGRSGKRIMQRRVWTIEDGEGAGLKIRFPQNRDYIFGTSERPVQEALTQHLHPGNVFYDVGANVGYFSLIAAKRVGPTGCVYAFEPVAENIETIHGNVNINKIVNVRSFELAVGRSSGNEELLLTEWDGGAALASSVVKPSAPLSRRNVRVVALDDFIQKERLRIPTLVKIDVEGVERDVIHGMSKTIAESKPVILFEIDDGNQDAFYHRWQELDHLIEGYGYMILHLENSYPHLKWNVGHSLALPKE